MEQSVTDKLKWTRKEEVAVYFKVTPLKFPGEAEENNAEP